MAVLSGNRVAWTYTADNGVSYRVAAQKALTDQGKLGGGAWNGTDGPRPSNFKMRRITVRSVGVGSRVLPVYSSDAAINTAGETVNANFAGDSHSFVSDGNPIPEQHLRKSVTKQAS